MSDVLLIADHRRGEIRDISYELVTAARDLASETGGEVHAAVISGEVDAFADKLSLGGIDVIHTVEHGEEFNHDVYTQVVEQLYAELSPTYLLMPHSANGLDYAPAVANALDLPFVTDVVNLAYDDSLVATREMYSSKVETTVEVAADAEAVAISVRGTEWPPTEEPADPHVEPFEADVDEDAVGSRIEGFEEMGGGDVDIADADVLVSVGRGIGEEENIELVERLADALDATLSSSRPIVDNNWLPKNRQVGQSGKVVTPDVYLAVGISGAVQHVAGMKGSDTIVAINNDSNAPIFDLADYGIVDDLFEVVPALIEEFE